MNISERVRKIVAEALYLSPEEVQDHSLLVRDLGAESIDFLDVIFRIEREFAIKVPKGSIEQYTRCGLSESEFAVDGKLTDLALGRLAEEMPELDQSLLKKGLAVRDLPSLFTVKMFARIVEQQVFGKAPSEAAVGTGADSAAEDHA